MAKDVPQPSAFIDMFTIVGMIAVVYFLVKLGMNCCRTPKRNVVKPDIFSDAVDDSALSTPVSCSRFEDTIFVNDDTYNIDVKRQSRFSIYYEVTLADRTLKNVPMHKLEDAKETLIKALLHSKKMDREVWNVDQKRLKTKRG